MKRFGRSRLAGTLVALGGVSALALLAFGGYEVLEAPSSQVFGSTLVHGAATLPEVALTFDDGPNPPYTERILGVLERAHVRATFFVVGRAVAAHPAVVRRMVRDGDALGNHTWDHAHLIVETPAAVRAELDRTQAAILHAADVRTDLMRPPFGARDFSVIREARRLGYTVVMWSVPLPDDWDQPGAAVIAARVLRHVGDGSIIVLHDGNRGRLCAPLGQFPAKICDRSQEAAATALIVGALRARGYRFVTIPQLLADSNAFTRTRVRRGR
ncbi:MAG: polysaccharide deacetylase family protein [Vulcanimicrobiaceae bacterium]